MPVIGKRKRGMTLSARKTNAGYLFILPWLIGFTFLFMIPIVWSIFYTFNEVSLKDTLTYTFRGLKYYADAFTEHPTFSRTLVESVGRMAIDTPLVLVFSLIAANLLNQNFKGRGVARTLFFIPIIYGTGVLLMLQQYDQAYTSVSEGMTSADYDSLPGQIINLLNFREMFLAGRDTVSLMNQLMSAVDRMMDIITRSGVQVLVFLAGLQAIPVSNYEAAKVEGASSFECFFKITLPLILPMFMTNMVFTVVDSFTRFDNQMINLIRDTTSGVAMDYSLGTTFSWIYFAVAAAFIAAAVFVLSRFMRERPRKAGA